MSCMSWPFEQSHVLLAGKSCTAKSAQREDGVCPSERGQGSRFPTHPSSQASSLHTAALCPLGQRPQ